MTSKESIALASRRTTIKKTILFLHSSDDLYGADQVLLQVATEMLDSPFRPLVVLPDDMAHVGLLSAELRRRGVDFMHAPIAIIRRRYFRPSGFVPLLSRAVRGSWMLRRIVREQNVILIYGFTFAVLAAPLAAIASRRPLVMHAHEILVGPSFVRRAMHKLFVGPAAAVACISNAVRRHILADEPGAAQKLCLVHNGLAPFEKRITKLAARMELGVHDGLPLIGMVGRVSAWKGQGVLLEAAAILRDRGYRFHCMAIGGVFDGDERNRKALLAQREQLGLKHEFSLVDFRPDVRALYSAFDIFVLPSIEPEPFGMVILEAMQTSLPVVASRHGGPLEIVIDGDTGLLFEPKNPSALADCLAQLLDDPLTAERMGQAGAKRWEEEFTFRRQASRLLEIFESVLANRSLPCEGDAAQSPTKRQAD